MTPSQLTEYERTAAFHADFARALERSQEMGGGGKLKPTPATEYLAAFVAAIPTTEGE